MQALILAGGEGTRLRPLTETIPKPVIPLVGKPFISYMLEWLRGHGVGDVVLACGFMADAVRAVLGDGAALGMRLRYIEEPEPLGTGGALKFAEEMLDERFLMLNGDVLTDIDLTALIEQHARTAATATLALYPVDDPSAYGLVRRNDDSSVSEFLEKPSPEEIDTNLINAGAYVLERRVLDSMPPAGTNVSIERDVFPALVGDGLYGYAASGYWLDIGTPDRYLQGTFDILDGSVRTEIGGEIAAAGGVLSAAAAVDGEVVAPALLGDGATVAAGATVGPYAVVGVGAFVAEGATVTRGVVLSHAHIGDGSTVTGSIVGTYAQIGRGCTVSDEAVIGAGAKIGAGHAVGAGARIVPGHVLGEQAIKS
ncbi:MAG TPA: NDP-sugar synthase [Solirubrobacteraceae bacterium]|jgi:mannose-1-phosphate guanylyltransferase|nr:NDP-sugar synthase [Solirubrobacteraceae bacterium]